MDAYSQLVSHILKNDVLAAEVQNPSKNDKSFLNLVCLDWQSRLDNSTAYQTFATNCEHIWTKLSTREKYSYQKVKGLDNDFKVIVVGQCRFGKMTNTSKKVIWVTGLGPLIQIGNAAWNQTVEFEEGTEFKFSFELCDRNMCSTCTDIARKYTKVGYQLKDLDLQPCIKVTKMFDGKNILNRFHRCMENLDEFMAILHLKVNVRYTYGSEGGETQYRYSGSVVDMVAFQESNLEKPQEVFLGELAPPPAEEEDKDEDEEPVAKKAKTDEFSLST